MESKWSWRLFSSKNHLIKSYPRLWLNLKHLIALYMIMYTVKPPNLEYESSHQNRHFFGSSNCFLQMKLFASKRKSNNGNQVLQFLVQVWLFYSGIHEVVPPAIPINVALICWLSLTYTLHKSPWCTMVKVDSTQK